MHLLTCKVQSWMEERKKKVMTTSLGTDTKLIQFKEKTTKLLRSSGEKRQLNEAAHGGRQ